MRDGTCSKCGNATVHMACNGLKLGEGNGATLYPHRDANFRGMLTGHRTDGMWQFVCGTCGYLELHLLDQAALAFIRQNWPMVPKRPTAQ